MRSYCFVAEVTFNDNNGKLQRLVCKNTQYQSLCEDALKDAYLETVFNEIDQFYSSIYYLLCDSGKIKSEIKNTAEAMGIQHYNLPKIIGTCFVGCFCRPFNSLLDVWPAFITAF